MATGGVLNLPVGRVGFRVEREGIELRGVRVAPLVTAPFHPELPAAADADTGIRPPRLEQNVGPVYPEAARRNGISGTVLLDIVVRPDGRVGDVRVAWSPDASMGSAAVACVKQWRFAPATKNGAPVAVTATADVAFTLRR